MSATRGRSPMRSAPPIVHVVSTRQPCLTTLLVHRTEAKGSVGSSRLISFRISVHRHRPQRSRPHRLERGLKAKPCFCSSSLLSTLLRCRHSLESHSLYGGGVWTDGAGGELTEGASVSTYQSPPCTTSLDEMLSWVRMKKFLHLQTMIAD